MGNHKSKPPNHQSKPPSKGNLKCLAFKVTITVTRHFQPSYKTWRQPRMMKTKHWTRARRCALRCKPPFGRRSLIFCWGIYPYLDISIWKQLRMGRFGLPKSMWSPLETSVSPRLETEPTPGTMKSIVWIKRIVWIMQGAA